LGLAGTLLLVVGGEQGTPTAFEFQLPTGVRPPPVPSDNPMNAAKVELGRRLFGDGRLSVTGDYSCASCHQPALAFTDGRRTAVGATGEVHQRNTPTLWNVGYAVTFGWADPSTTSLEAQQLIPLHNHLPVELGFDQVRAQRLAELNADPQTAPLAAAAFGSAELDERRLVQALACYVRTLISADSAFDRYLYWGEPLPVDAARGMQLFFSDTVNCARCHASFNLSAPIAVADRPRPRPVFHNTGLYNLGGGGGYPDAGLAQHTHRKSDTGAFRAPTLRNVAVTAPYMHDGSVATLADVIDIYAAGGRVIEFGAFAGDGRINPFKRPEIRALTLTAQDKLDLLAFLRSLTDARYVRGE
jgi:cytochrome c peroxidase